MTGMIDSSENDYPPAPYELARELQHAIARIAMTPIDGIALPSDHWQRVGEAVALSHQLVAALTTPNPRTYADPDVDERIDWSDGNE